eukprot:522834_1
MSTEEFPDVHAAYMKYVDSLSIEPTNPTQLIKFAKKQNIQGLTWSKCSKYFKILNGQSTEIHKAEPPKNWSKNRRYSNEIKAKKHHHKTTSNPILNINQSLINNNTNNHNIKKNDIITATTNTITTNTSSISNHRRTQSAIDAETHKQNVVKNETPFHTVKVDKLFTELKETEIDTDEINGNGNGNVNGNGK